MIAFCFLLLLLLPTCNAQYTTITGVWNDDYRTTSSVATPGWERHYQGIVAATTYSYHGTFYGDGMLSSSGREIYYITRQFYCSTFDSSVDITYTVYYCNCDGSDYVQLFINDNSVATVTTYTSSGTSWYDYGLPSCTFYSKPVGPISIPLVTLNNLFKLDFKIAPNRNGEYIELSNIQITCHPLTDPPTTAIPTVNPTFDPTHDPTHDPTLDPTHDPTLYPTNNPSNQPTLSPTTSVPTTTAPTTSTPTTSSPTPNPTPNDQQIHSVDDPQTTDISIDPNHGDKQSISSNKNNFVNSILFYIVIGCASILTCIIFIFCILFIRKKQKQQFQISKNIKADYSNTKTISMVNINNINQIVSSDEDVMTGIEVETLQNMDGNTQIAQQIQSVMNDFNAQQMHVHVQSVINDFNVGVVTAGANAMVTNEECECDSKSVESEEDDIVQEINLGAMTAGANEVVILGDDEVDNYNYIMEKGTDDEGTQTDEGSYDDYEGNDDVVAGLETRGGIHNDDTPPAPPPPPPPPPDVE